MKTIELKVTGMHCIHCEKHVADSLEKVAGVEKAVADHNHDRVLVRLSDDNASIEAMKAAVEADDSGFKCEGVVA
ncbi:MAG: heavy-metal-associated domain-containing protein [Solobacterium sp.]|nr:heavy-metal-associated domain-containing protein [Solobacterium sp.]